MVHPVRLERTYSSYTINDRLEGGGDTGVFKNSKKYYTSFLGTSNIYFTKKTWKRRRDSKTGFLA